MTIVDDERLFTEDSSAHGGRLPKSGRKKRSPRSRSPRKAVPFEKKYERLETVLNEIEREDLPLEDLLKLFEEGVGLVKECSAYLREAKLTVESYLEEREGAYTLKGLDSPAEE